MYQETKKLVCEGLDEEDPEAKSLSAEELVKQVIKPNIPKMFRKIFELLDVSTMTIEEVRTMLALFFSNKNNVSNQSKQPRALSKPEEFPL